MSLSALAICLDGRHYNARLVALDGRIDIPAVVPPTPTPTPTPGGFTWTNRKPFARHGPGIKEDDEEILFILAVLERENLL